MVTSPEMVVDSEGLPILSMVCAADVSRYLRMLGGEASVEGLLESMQQGLIWTAVHVRFTEGIGARNRRAWLEAALSAHSPKGASLLAEKEVRAFLDLQTRTVNVNDRLDYLFPPGGTMWVRPNAGRARKFTHPGLVQAVRMIQFSDPRDDPGGMIRILGPMLSAARGIREGN